MNRKAIIAITLSITFVLFGVAPAQAQVKKGERLMESGRYVEAVRPLRKAFDDNGENREAGILLMECHYQLQEYQEALDVGTLLNMDSPQTVEEARLFADVRIANNDFSGAYLGLIEYLSENEYDRSIYYWLDKASYLLSWDTLKTQSVVEELSGINSVYNEYAPYMSEEGLWFVSDQVTVQAVFPTAFSNQSLHLLYQTTLKNSGTSWRRAKMLMRDRDYYYHDGPLAYDELEDRYALSLREIDGVQDKLKVGIFFSDLSGSEENLVPFEYNEGQNAGHPTFADGGQRMYFASDRPGGYGQMDIWYCDRVNGKWTQPKNLGPKVNTPGNEVFPHYSKARLFYSSDRRDKGYGGLDIYYVSLKDDELEPYNLRSPINGAYDDFSVSMREDFTGYLSSNRRSGLGGDDIWAFEFVPQQERVEAIRLAIEGTSTVPITMRIFDSRGEEVKGVEVDRFGVATVSELNTREVYTLETEGLFDSEGVLVVYNAQGKPIRRFQGEDNKYEFELLDEEKYGLGPQENIDDSELFDLLGEVVTEEETAYDSVSVVLRDDQGKDLNEVSTDEEGRFEFEGLMTGVYYDLFTRGLEVEHGIDVLGKTGAPTQSLKETFRNTFAYTRTQPVAWWMMDAEIVVPVVFAMVPTVEFDARSEVELYAYQDSLVRTCKTDEDGFIELGSLVAGHAYEVKFAEAKFERTDRLVILGGSGDTTQTVRPKSEDSYVFEYMVYGDINEDGEKSMDGLDYRVYSGEMKDWRGKEKARFLVSSEGNEWRDTIWVRANGTFLLEIPSQYAKYSVQALDQSGLGSKNMVIYDAEGNEVLNEFADESGIFDLTFLNDDVYAMRAEDNTDDSQLYDYDGRIENWNRTSGTEFILFDENGEALDTLVVKQLGIFTVYGVKPGKYSLRSRNADIDLRGMELILKKRMGGSTISVNSKDGSIFTFELLTDQEYALEKEANRDRSSLFEYGASIDNWGVGESTRFVLYSAKGVPLDTITTSSGNFSLGNLRTGPYRLKNIGDGSNLSSRPLSLTKGSDQEILVVESRDGRSYDFELMEDAEYPLGYEENRDESRLDATITGKTDIQEKGRAVQLFDKNKNLLSETYTLEGGEFAFTDIPVDSTYMIKAAGASKLEASSDRMGLSVNGVRSGEYFTLDYTEAAGKRRIISIPEVYYAFNSYALNTKSREALDELAKTLNGYPHLRIKILSHTDSRGPSSYNLTLSKQRARRVVEYLIEKGVEKDRLEFEGRGERDLINRCKDGVRCSNAEHAKNRRTEFEVLD